MSERLEHLLNFFVRFFDRDIFDVDVVNDLSEILLVSWLILDGFDFFSFAILLGLDMDGAILHGIHGELLILKADEAVATGSMVFIQRDLQALDLTVLLHQSVQLFMSKILWDLHEDVVGLQLVLVATEELSVKWQGSALAAFDLEVPHFFTGLCKFLGVLDQDLGGIKWLGQISPDLWLLVLLEHNSASVVESLSNPVAGSVFLRQIVKVNQLLNVHCVF